jgi:leishmanolysin
MFAFWLLLVGLTAVVTAHGGDDHSGVPLMPREHVCIHDSEAVQRLIAHDHARSAHVQQGESAHREGRHFVAQAPESIRFVISTQDLELSSQYCTAAGDTRPDFQGATLTCAASDVLTTAKKDLLLNQVLPVALERLAARIKVTRLTSNLMVGSFGCSGFTVPAAHKSTGVPNADFVLYVAAGPISGSSTLAWAGSCQSDSNGRPIVGRANFDPQFLTYTSAADLEQQIDTATHELTHALGFSSGSFGGNRSTTTTKRGKTVKQLVMPGVVAAARTFTGCSTLDGVELEDEGSAGSAGSHLERRLYKDDIMTAAGGSQISALTLQVLQDLNVGYTVDLNTAETMSWGNNTGCGFHTERCDTVAGGRGTYFCFDETSSANYCTHDLTATGYCAVGTASADFPTYFQYYPGQPTKGSSSTFMDGCPHVAAYSNRVCTEDRAATATEYRVGHTFAPDARCFYGYNVVRRNSGFGGSDGPLCLEARCSLSKVDFKINGSAYVSCSSDNVNVTSPPTYTGTIACPVAADMCASLGVSSSGPTPTPTNTGAGATTTVGGATTTTSVAATPVATSTPATSGTPIPPPTPSATPTTVSSGNGTCEASYVLAAPSPSTVLTVDIINAILKAHNDARRAVIPSAGAMPLLTWDQRLADFGQEYLDSCPGMVHSTTAMRSNQSRFGTAYVGENLAAGTAYSLNVGGPASVNAWNSELTYWSYPNTCQAGQVCGHYTQNIWATTLRVGCGFKYCPNQPYGYYWICNYAPGGNSGGNPYTSAAAGAPVAACQFSANSTPSPPTTTQPSGATTPQPPTTTLPSTIFTATMRIRGSSFGVLLNNPSYLTLLLAAVRSDIAGILGSSTTAVTIISLRLGSLLVDFSVNDQATVSANTATYMLRTAENTSAWLVQTTTLYQTNANATEALVIESTTTTVSTPDAPNEVATDDDKPSCGTACWVFIAVSIAVSLCVVGVVLYIARRCCGAGSAVVEQAAAPPTKVVVMGQPTHGSARYPDGRTPY